MIINYWTNASPTTRKSIYVMSIIFALIVIIVPSVWIQNTKRADNRMNAAVSDNNSLSENRLHVYIKLSVVNTDDYTYTLIMKITPFGNLSDTKSNLTRYNAQIDLSVKGQRFTFPKFSPAGLIEFKTNFQTGTSNSFPFDKYLDEFDISGVLTSDTGGVEFINLRTDYTGTFDSFDANVHVTSYNSKSTFSLEIVRTGTTRFFSISVILLMWALSFTILTLSVTIWIRNRVVEPPTIAVAAGLLFAIPQLRNVQPGIPAIGCAADTLSFFWCMALIASSLLLLMWNYIIKKKEKSSSHDDMGISPRLYSTSERSLNRHGLQLPKVNGLIARFNSTD